MFCCFNFKKTKKDNEEPKKDNEKPKKDNGADFIQGLVGLEASRGNLMQAITNGNDAKAEELISAGADVNATDNDGTTPLIMAVGLCAGFGMVKVQTIESLLDAGADVNKAQKDGSTPLLAACMNGSKELVLLLLARGANPNTTDRVIGNVPLIWAIKKGEVDIVDKFLAAGADPNMKSKGKVTPLSTAAKCKNLAIFEKLLAAGATVADGDAPVKSFMQESGITQAKEDDTAKAEETNK